jgi:hypothetical protein
MSLMQKLEQAVEAVTEDAEHAAEEDIAAAREAALRLAHQAEAAESDVITYVVNHRAEIIAVARQYEPQVVQALEAVVEKLLANVKGSFEVG